MEMFVQLLCSGNCFNNILNNMKSHSSISNNGVRLCMAKYENT